EVGAAQLVAGGQQGGHPCGGRYVHRQDLEGLLRRGPGAEQFLGGRGQPADTAHRASPSPVAPAAPAAGGLTGPLRSAAAEGRAAPVPYRSPSDSRAIFSWSFRIPWSSASG